MKYKIAATALTYIAIIGMLMFITTPIATTEVKYIYYWTQDLSDNTIIIDGNLNDWTNASYIETNLGVNVSIGYDDTNIYVAALWTDTALNDQLSLWNKTGMIDENEAEWDFIDGSDDRLAVGFVNEDDSDIWVWTASNITDGIHAYEINITGHPDSGNLPFVMNSNGTTLGDTAKPIYNSTFQTITDYSVVPNGTMINAWFSQAPNGSQTDVNVAFSYNMTGNNVSRIEFSRAIDTGNEDDVAWDLSDLTGIHFVISSSNRNDAEDMNFYMSSVEQTREWYDITVTTNIHVLGDAKIYTTGINNGTLVTGTQTMNSVTWRLLAEPSAFPKIVSFLIIIGMFAAVLAGIFFIAGKKIGMIIAAAVIGLVSGVVMLVGGIMFQSWVVWHSENIFFAFEEIEFLDDLEYGFITLTNSGLGLGFYTPIICGGLIAATTATLLGLSIYGIFSKKKIKQKE